MWLQHPQFPDIVTQTWLNQPNYPTGLIFFFTDLATHWNKHNFGNIFCKKKILIDRLKGIQRMHPSTKDSFHYNLENQLITEFNSLLHSEEKILEIKITRPMVK